MLCQKLPIRIFTLIFVLRVTCYADWNCPVGSQFCYQESSETFQNWNETRDRCNEIEAELPGIEHLKDLSRLRIQQNVVFWTSLCFSDGHLQWLGSNPYKETDLNFIESLLPDLTSSYLLDDQMYCFHTGINQPNSLAIPIGLVMKNSQEVMMGICVKDSRAVRYPSVIAPSITGRVVSATVESSSSEMNGIERRRDGFVNIFDFKGNSMKFKCNVETTQSHQGIKIKWMRNGAYIGNFSEEIVFTSEDDFIPWIGLITCEASYRDGEEIRSEGLQVVMWNTVTARLTSNCINCRLQTILNDAKNILRQIVESDIAPGFGRSMEFFNESPVIQRSNVSFIIHIRNKRIEHFDFKMAQRLGSLFPLSEWAEDRSLFLSEGLYLDVISPCNMAVSQNRQNLTWVGYLGQIVPSGNFIDGPICVDRQGDIITRSCGRPDSQSTSNQECFNLKPRQEEPLCFEGFELADGRCYRMTDATNFATALAQCWAGWPIQPQILESDSFMNWVIMSKEVMHRTRSVDKYQSFWIPLRRLNQGSSLQTPVWMTNTESNRWMYQQNLWNISDNEHAEEDESCAAYDLELNQVVLRSCQSQLPMFCNRPVLPQPISGLISQQHGHVGEYFCPPGWLTHWLVMDKGICFKRFILQDAIDADEAQQFCMEDKGHLATAPTHNMRIAMQQVHAVFNNRSVATHSWIGLRHRDESLGAFTWLKELAGQTDVNNVLTYNWQSYSDFGGGYGVSIGNDHKWWNWPRQMKLKGVLCQKTITDWRNAFRLRLEPPSDPIREGEYVLIFNYDPKPSMLEDKNDLGTENWKLANQIHQSFVTQSLFWQTDFDVVCHFGSYVRRFSFPRAFRRQYRALVQLPTSLGSGRLTCEAWLTRPTFRFQSNTIIHRPSQWYNFVMIAAHRMESYNENNLRRPRNVWNEDLAAESLRRRLIDLLVNQNLMMSNLTVTKSYHSPNQSELANVVNVLYRISFFLPRNIQRIELFSIIRQCRNGWIEQMDLISPDMDNESILLLLLQSCLPLTFKYDDHSFLMEIRSTVACPASVVPSNTLDRLGPDAYLTSDRLSWPKTRIGSMARSIQPCILYQNLVHRLCKGSFERGAFWGPIEIPELDEKVEANAVCQLPDSTAAKLEQFERMSRSMNSLVTSETANSILKEILLEWEQPQMSLAYVEMTISTLRNVISAAQNLTMRLDRLLITSILTRMVRRGQSPLTELQFLPHVLDNLIQLFSDLPLLGVRGTRINMDDEVLIVAEGSESRNQIFLDSQLSVANVIDFDRGSVTVVKDSNNGYMGGLFTIVTVLPIQLLTLDPRSKTNYIDMYALDASDPAAVNLLGKYYAGETTVHVNFRASTSRATPTLSEPYTLSFKEDSGLSSFSEGTFVCAKWNSRLISSSQGGWYTGDCWYLGQDINRTHVCRCKYPGVYGLFRSDDDGELRLALIRRLSFIINVVFFILLSAFLIINSVRIYRKTTHQMDLIEMSARLQMVVSWTAMLFAQLGQYLVPGYLLGCLVLMSMFQFFLTAAFLWQCALVIARRWQIYQQFIDHQISTIVKITCAIWGFSAIIVVSIAIYKWNYLDPEQGIECWLEDPIDFALTVAIVCLTGGFSLIFSFKNANDQFKLIAFSEWRTNEWSTILNTPIMVLAGLLAVISNSWLRTTSELSILFCCVSLLLGFLWLCTFWTLISNSWVHQDFQNSNRNVDKDFQMKSIVYSPETIEYLANN